MAGSWNCVGNPYSSAIGINSASSSVSRFIEANADNLDVSYGAVYIWDHEDTSNDVDTRPYTIISNVPVPETPIAVQQGQGFMVKMKTGKSSVSFNSSMQFHSPTLALKSATAPWPTIKLITTSGNRECSTIVAFNGGMTKGLDPTYDAGLFKAGTDLLVYTKLGDG